MNQEKESLLKKILNYLLNVEATIRFYLFFSKQIFGISLRWFIPKYIREQIDRRVKSEELETQKEIELYTDGKPNTFLTKDSHHKDFNFPSLMCKREWKDFCKNRLIVKDGYVWKRGKRYNFKKFEL